MFYKYLKHPYPGNKIPMELEKLAPKEGCLHFTTTCHITQDTDLNIQCGKNLRSQNT